MVRDSVPLGQQYRRRVGFVMDIAAEDEQRTVLWIGQPPMRGGFDSRMQLLNELYQIEADAEFCSLHRSSCALHRRLW